jgi:hypothetical protein
MWRGIIFQITEISMSPFHSGMNHWQRQWLSDRLHKKGQTEPVSTPQYFKAKPPPPSGKTEPSQGVVVSKRKAPQHRPSKIAWPSSEVLEKLLWVKPTSQIAKDLGVSDKAVEKHCKKLVLKKPPRGYWAKINAGLK